jgi:hypothetical protein
MHEKNKCIKHGEFFISLYSSRVLTKKLNIIIHRTELLSADRGGRAVWYIGLWLFVCCGCGFESSDVVPFCLLSAK